MGNFKQSFGSPAPADPPELLASNAMDSSREVRLDLAAVNSTTELNPTTMADSSELSTSAPAGIEEDVLTKINAFLERTEPARPSLSRRGASHQMEAWWTKAATSSSAKASSATSERDQDKYLSPIDEEGALEFDPDDFRSPPSEDSSLDYDDEFSEKDALLSSDNNEVPAPAAYQHNCIDVIDPKAPKIIARYIYPTERTPPPLPPRKHVPPPTLFSLVAMLWAYLLSFIIPNEPEIIEYSPQEIKRRAGEISVEAQVVEFPAEPEKVVGVMALIHVGDGEHRQPYPITAKPKRVHELMKDAVGSTAEDVYRKQIKSALKALQNMAD